MRQLRQNVAAGQIFGIRDRCITADAAVAPAECLENVAPLRPYPALSGPIRPYPATACLRSMPHDSSSTLGRPAFAIPRLSLPAAR